MKKSLLAIAAMTAFAGAAQAQSSVTIYGVMDVGVMGQTNAGNLNSSTAGTSTNPVNGGGYKGGSNFGFMQGGESASRLGFKGTEDLGGGTKAVFLLEQGFSTANGSLAATGLPGNGASSPNSTGDSSNSGQLFNRGAYAGLSNAKYGTLTLGRQQTLMLDNIGNYNPVNSQMFSPIGFSGSFGGGGYTDMARANGALKYKQKVMGVDVNALYAPGGYAGNNSAGTRLEGNLGYESAKWGVQALYAYQEGATSMAGVTASGAAGAAVATSFATIVPANAVAVTWANTSSWQFTSKYKVMDKLTAMAGYQFMSIGTPSNFSYYQNQAVMANGSGFTIDSNTARTNRMIVNTFWVGAQYDFTPTIKGSIGYYQGNTNAQNNATTSTLGGTNKYESAMVEYYMSKRTNLYAAVMNVNSTGSNVITPAPGSKLTNNITNQQTYGLGMRHTF